MESPRSFLSSVSFQRVVFSALRTAFGLIFVFAGVMKFLNIRDFATTVATLDILPAFSVPYFALAVPSFELLLGAAITLNLKTKPACDLTFLALAVFTAALVGQMASGARGGCGCFGQLSTGDINGWTISRNVLLMIWAMLLSVHHRSRSAPEEVDSAGVSPALAHLSKWDSLNPMLHNVSIASFLCVIALCFVPASQNRTLKERLAIITAEASSLAAGDSASPIHGLNLSGRQVTVEFTSSRRVVLFAMKQSCAICAQNLPAWSRLTRLVNTARVKVIGILIDSVGVARRYAEEHQVAFEVISVPDRSFLAEYKILATPQTILIESGKVVKVWRGLLSDGGIGEVLTLAATSGFEAASMIPQPNAP